MEECSPLIRLTVRPTGGGAVRLELRVPPDVVWLAVAISQWLASRLTPDVAVAAPIRAGTAGVIFVIGIALIVAARVMLNLAHTTWHPSEPARTVGLVTVGVFRYSRNPTYLGMLLVLVGWSVALSNPIALLLAGLFVLYMNRFQIRPEERALAAGFGCAYREYAERVRRWI